MSREQWSEARVDRETLAAISAVMKAAGCTIKSGEIEYATPADRAEALTKAHRYRQLAGQMTDLHQADQYQQLAKQALQEAGLPS